MKDTSNPYERHELVENVAELVKDAIEKLFFIP